MKTLICEDDPAQRRILEAKLPQWGYEVVSTCDGLEAWEVMQSKDAPQLAILDWVVPGMSGIEVCQKIREKTTESYVYIILVTSKGEKEDIVTGIDAGADDYLIKPFNTAELRVRLRAGRRILDLQAQLIESRETYRSLATHDQLTGLWNREAGLDILRRELARSQRGGTPCCVAMMDIDHFKHINDTYGHMIGDVVLRITANRIVSSLRCYDEVARYGGEEFLGIIPSCDGPTGAKVAERIRASIAQSPVRTSEGNVEVNISIGVASTDDGKVINQDELINAADKALYLAKNNGRNRVEVAASGETIE